MMIQKDTPIIIFGAGAIGNRYYELLRAQGMSIRCFIDWNADKVRPRHETPILYPDDDIIRRDDAIVIIGLSNVFLHKEIVAQLDRLGYRFFVYYCDYSKEIRTQYENFTRGQSLVGTKALKYETQEELWEDDIVFEGDEVIVPVPFEIIFMSIELHYTYIDTNRNYWLEMNGKPIFSHKAYINLYEVFERGLLNVKDSDIFESTRQFFCEKELNSYQGDNFEKAYNKWLYSRYMVWQMMTRQLFQNSSFFYESAPQIRKNERGVFEVNDGNNRASFFMAKHIYKMPYRMSRDDYEAWINRKVLEEIKRYIKSNEWSKFPYPIPHPYFYSFEVEREAYAPKRLKAIYDFLDKIRYNVEGKRVLDINGKVGYYASFFYNMGADSIAIENEQKYVDFIILLNELFGWKVGVKYYEEFLEEVSLIDIAIVSIMGEMLPPQNLICNIMNYTTGGIFVEMKEEDACSVANDITLQKKFAITPILKELVEEKILITLALWKKE